MTLLNLLGTASVALFLVGYILLLIFIAAHIYQVTLHFVLRKKGLAEERQILHHPLSADAAIPDVVVQIPVFNEGGLLERAISAACALDWPLDKLHIQICDDSTDKTSPSTKDLVNSLSSSGVDVAFIRRTDRFHFKAGSLHYAMSQTSHKYFAIFDVDYVPPSDFLRRCMPVLLASNDIAFVQSRTDFLNADENMLTRAQVLVLDAHYAEQATRTWAGHPLPFNGTGGIWRREAIEAGGGWRGETLAEDMELTYKTWIAGWRGVFLTSVSVPSELPSNLKAWTTQQRRWTTGSGQVASTVLPTVLRSLRLSIHSPWSMLMQLLFLVESLVFSMTICAAILTVLFNSSNGPLIGSLVLTLILAEASVIFGEQWLGHRLFRRRGTFSRFFLDFLYALALSIYPICVNIRYLGWMIPGRKTIFERTPKKGH